MIKRLIGFLKSDGFKKHLSNLGWMFFARIIGMIISILVAAYVTRVLGPTNYGELSYALSFITLFSVFSNLGIDQILYRELIKRPQDKNELLGSSITIKTISGSIAAVIVLVVAYLTSTDQLSFWLIAIMSLSFLFNGWNIIGHEFQAEVRSKYPAFITLYVTIILSIIKIVIISTGGGVIYLAAIVTFEQVLYMFFYIFFRYKYIGSIRAWFVRWETTHYLIIQSIPLMISMWFVFVYTRADQIIIKFLLDTTSVGLYDAGVRIAEAWQFVPQFIVHSLFPALFGAKILGNNTYGKKFIRLAIFLIIFMSAIAGTITFFARPIILILYGAEFSPSIGVLQIYSWAGVAVGIWYLAQYFLIAEDKQSIALMSTFVVMAVNIGLNFILIPIYGIYGAAWATTISYFCSILVFISYKSIRFKLKQIIRRDDIM